MLINNKTNFDVIRYFTDKLNSWGPTALEEASANDLIEILAMVPDNDVRQGIMQVLSEMPGKGKELESLWKEKGLGDNDDNDDELGVQEQHEGEGEAEAGGQSGNSSPISRLRQSVGSLSGRFTDMIRSSPRQSNGLELTTPRRSLLSPSARSGIDKDTDTVAGVAYSKDIDNDDDNNDGNDDDTHIIELTNQKLKKYGYDDNDNDNEKHQSQSLTPESVSINLQQAEPVPFNHNDNDNNETMNSRGTGDVLNIDDFFLSHTENEH